MSKVAERASAPSRAMTYLRLGRVSNLPTVWTNVVAGALLGGADARLSDLWAPWIAMTAAYVGGMFLNDAFDRKIDATERPERPIPAGHVGVGEVYGVGFGLLAISIAVIGAASSVSDRGLAPTAGALTLAILIVAYDAWHKGNPFSSVLMGGCRAAVYATAALSTGGAPSRALLVGATALLAYVVGLTLVARQENRQSFRGVVPVALLAAPLAAMALLGPVSAPVVVFAALYLSWAVWSAAPLFRSGAVNVPRAVVSLIAGMSLVDALFVASTGATEVAGAVAMALGATLALQRWVQGT